MFQGAKCYQAWTGVMHGHICLGFPQGVSGIMSVDISAISTARLLLLGMTLYHQSGLMLLMGYCGLYLECISKGSCGKHLVTPVYGGTFKRWSLIR